MLKPTADEAVRTGKSAPHLSYVSIDRIVQTALRAGAKAICQVYRVPLRKFELRRACELANVVFIGPRAATIRPMAMKHVAKPTASEAGAEAIKVESPEGNPVRRFPQFVDAEGAGECGVSGANVPVEV